MRLGHRLLALTLVALIGLVLLVMQAGQAPPRPDVVTLNGLRHEVAQQWPQVSLPQELAVTVFIGERPVASSEQGWANPLEAAGDGALAAPVVVDGQSVAVLYLASGEQWADRQRELLITAATIVLVVTALALAWTLWQHRKVVLPFRRLETFARDVAAGDLDAPLRSSGDFGAWASSFDLLRTELAATRRREAAAQRARRELVEQVRHDIRTPVASIAATTELLLVHQHPPAVGEKLESIAAKAQQLASLVGDLDADAEQLTLDMGDVDSTVLAGLLRDDRADVRVGTVPECVLRIDLHRLRQVFDNVISNSMKFAGTPITVGGTLDDEVLQVTIADDGPGVPDQEREAVLGRGIRGSNATDVPGQGLGLFTAAQLMERMGGALWIEQGQGFRITLAIPLSGAVRRR